MNRFWFHVSNYKFRSLFYRTLLISVLLVIVPLFVLTLVVVGQSNSGINEEIHELTRRSIERAREMLDAVFVEASYVTASVSLLPDARLFLTRRLGDAPLSMDTVSAVVKVLQSFKYTIRYVDSIYLYSEENAAVVTQDSMTPLEGFQDKGWMDAYRRRTDGTPFRVSRSIPNRGPAVISVIKPVVTLDVPRPWGAVVVNLKLASMGEGLADRGIRDELTIIDEEGVVLYAPDPAEIGLGSADLPEPSAGGFAIRAKDITATARSASTDLTYVMRFSLDPLYKRQRQLRDLAFTLLVISFLCAIVASFFLACYGYQPIHRILSVVEDPRETAAIPLRPNEIRDIASSVVRTLSANRSLKEELGRQMAHLDRTMTAALQAQINPHFLYNTLDTIRWSAMGLTGGKENEAAEMIGDLARLLRLSLETDDAIVSVEREVEHARTYVSLLKARHSRKLEVRWDIDPDVSDCAILKLCLQPVIENAFYHGIKPLRRAGMIRIEGHRTDERLLFRISDNGNGIPPASLQDLSRRLEDPEIGSDEHIGLLNVNRRIRLVFGEGYGLTVRSEPGEGTCVRLLFPFRRCV